MRDWVFLNPKYKNISDKAKSLTFLKKGNDDKHVHYESIWKNWTFSLMITGIGWSIWAVLIVLLNTLAQIEMIDYSQIESGFSVVYFPTIPSLPGGTLPSLPSIGDLFRTTDYNMWINIGKILGWIMFAIGSLAFILAIWQILKIRNFRFQVYTVMMEGYKPKSHIEQVIIAEILGIINFDTNISLESTVNKDEKGEKNDK